MEKRKPKKRIVTVNGTSGCGKSKTIIALSTALPSPPYKHYSTGQVVRDMAAAENMPIDAFRAYALKEGIDFDAIVDNKLKEIAISGDFYIIDSRLGYYHVPDSFKVLLYVDPAIAAKRRLHDLKKSWAERYENVTLEEMQKELDDRNKSDLEKYEELYGTDCNDRSNYDLCINTDHYSLMEVAELIAKAYVQWLKEEEEIFEEN